MSKLKLTILSMLASVLFTMTTYAETLKIIIPAGPDGSFNTRFQILKGEIEKTWGDDIKFVWGDNCSRGTSLVNNEKGPMLTVWDANFNLNEECTFNLTEDNVIAVETMFLRMCAAPGSNITSETVTQPGASWKVGHSTPHSAYAKWVAGFNKGTGTKLQPVPYSSSGSARRGVLAGDVDLVFISPSNSNKLMKAGGTCFYSSGPEGESKYKLPALSSITSFDKASINLSAFYSVKNVSKEKVLELRKLFNDIAAGENTEFTKFAGTKDLYLVGTTSQMSTEEMVGFVNETANHWR